MSTVPSPAGYWQYGGMILKLLVVLCLMVLQPLAVTGQYGMQTCEEEAEIDELSDTIEIDIDCQGSGNVVVHWTFYQFIQIDYIIIGYLCYTDPQDVENPCLYNIIDENSSKTTYSTTTSKTNCIAKGCFKVPISRDDYVWASISNVSCYFDSTNHQVVHNQSSEALPPAACITTTSPYSIQSSSAVSYSSSSTIKPSITPYSVHSSSAVSNSSSSTIKPSITLPAYPTISGSATSTVQASNKVTRLTVSTVLSTVSTSNTVDPQNPFNLDPTIMTIISIVGYAFGVIGLVFCCCACIMAIWCCILSKNKRKLGSYELEQLPKPTSIADQEDSLCNSFETTKTEKLKSYEMT